jgi:cyclic 2,3-diphosphoglycerate synthetase
MRRALAVIDGEHYAPVVRDALASQPDEVVAALLVGGTEKLRGDDDYGVPLANDLESAVAEFDPEVILDFSDEPVLGPAARFRLASRVLALGLPYEGPGFRFEPPELAVVATPTLAVIGTGKRVGKTAVTGHVARLLAADRRVVVVSMGRGGPPEPELVEEPPSVERLLELSREGRHAASDYLETAALAGVPTVGCRRCGGGLAGATATSNVAEGVALAEGLEPDLLVLDGSGAALPPIAADTRILVARTHEDATSYLNAYRLLLSDLVVLGEGGDAAAIREVKDVPAVRVRLRLRPQRPLEGRRVAVFTTGPAPVDELDAEVVLVSRNLADRAALREDLARADADVYLVELKAAAVDVVAEEADRRGVELVLAANDVEPCPGEDDLDELVRGLVGTPAGAGMPL